MEKTRDLEDKSLPQPERKQPQNERDARSEPQPLDDDMLDQVGGGYSAPRGNW